MQEPESEEQIIEETQVIKVEQDASESKQSNEPKQASGPEEPNEAHETSRKKLKSTSIIIGLVALAGIWIVIVVGTMTNPIYKTVRGLQKFLKQNQYDVTIGIQTHIKDDVIDEITQELDNKIQLSVDRRKGTVQGAYAIGFNNKEIIDVAMVVKDNYLYIDIPKVLNKGDYFYKELEDEEVNQETLALIMKYINKVDLKAINLQSYGKALTRATKGSVENKWNKVEFDLDGRDLMNMLESLLETAQNDKKLPKAFKKNATGILEEMISDRFEWDYNDKDDWRDILEYIEDEDFEDEFKDQLEMMVDDFKDSKQYIKYALDPIDVKMVVTFDLWNNIKEVVLEPKVDGGSIVFTVETGKGYKATQVYNTKKGNDMDEYPWSEFEYLLIDVANYLEDYVDNNKKLRTVIEDIMYETDYIDKEEFITDMMRIFLNF